MRRWAYLKTPCEYNDHKIFKVMIYETEDAGVYVFLYDSPEAQICVTDEWYACVTEAVGVWDRYVKDRCWTEITDPLPDCQDDCILPIRVKGRNVGMPIWGVYEILVNGEWVAYQE